MSNSQASSSKKGKANVNAASFFDLKAELSKQEDAFSKSKLLGKGKAEPIVGGAKRTDKKPTVWARPNKGVHARARRDVELEAISKPTLESARAALERKAQIYDKLQRGKGAGLTEKQRDSLLVDFDSRDNESDSDSSLDRDESLVVPRPGDEDPDDPIVEYEDEFGRLRTARKSEVPRDRLPESVDLGASEIPQDDDPDVVFGRATHFPVFQPTQERLNAIQDSLVEDSPFARYDASKDNRATGAAFYQFSADEETRRREMEELKGARKETEYKRAEVGVLDTELGRDGPSGERQGGVTAGNGVSRAIEKRRRELDERRKMLEAKRRKMLGGDDRVGGADDFLASLEKDLFPTPAPAPATA
ncbi:hypothetical protein BDV93DRAFT_522674 [Ceratobasidium sp. AG-I]|nr:hypothetical protein BDV93DRAFT_522674 [Ceratobasidium sp. AG-I]